MLGRLFEKRNKGMTLIELVVVMAILSILSTGLYSMTGVLTGRGARKTADELISLLSRAKVTAMGRSKGAGEAVYNADTDVYIRFCQTANNTTGAVLVGGTDTTPVQLTGRGVTISAVVSKGITDKLDAAGDISINDVRLRTGYSSFDDEMSGVRIAFNRKNGSMIPYAVTKQDGKITEKQYIKKLIVKQGDKEIVIRITPATGDIWEER